MARMKMCPQCGLQYDADYEKARIYCSRACRWEADAERRIATFWDQADQRPGCWLWKGGVQSQGYGRTMIRRRSYLAHRLAWELTKGPIPAGLEVMHKCDTPLCVKPDHLMLGTHLDNMRDMRDKGRAGIAGVQGERVGTAKLTAEKVRRIRGLRTAGRTQKSIADEMGVSTRAIQFVLNGTRWRHV